jgi:hypothetical protein
MMAAPRQFDSTIPRRVQLIIDVPMRLSTKVIEQQIEMFGSHLRFVLGGYYRQQVYEHCVKRCAAQDARKAALEAAARDAEAQEAAADVVSAAGRKRWVTA